MWKIYLSVLNLLPDDYILDEKCDRVSKDSVVNENGKLQIIVCKSTGLRIMNGRAGDPRVSCEFTCIKHAGSTMVDMKCYSIFVSCVCVN